MNEKEKLKLLKEAEYISRKNMKYTNKKRKKLSCLLFVVIIYLAGMIVSLFLISYVVKFLKV